MRHVTLRVEVPAIHGLYATFLEPLAEGELVRLGMKLRFREMLEQTGLLADEINESIQPQFDAILVVLGRHVGAPEPDDDLRRLAVCVTALGVNLFVTDDVYEVVAPSLKFHPDATALWAERLVMFGEAMVLAEARRRAGSVVQPPVKAKKK